jgi:hypothetical protein
VPVSKSKTSKFVMINPHIANLQIPLVSLSSPQIANQQMCKEKSNVFDPDMNWFACNTFFYLR